MTHIIIFVIPNEDFQTDSKILTKRSIKLFCFTYLLIERYKETYKCFDELL